MTTTRPTPGRSWSGLAEQVGAAFHSQRGATRLFFEPPADGLTGDIEDPRQAPQAAAFFVSPQNHLTCGFTVTVGCRSFTTAALTRLAPVTLLAVGREAVADKFLTATMAAFECDGDQSS